MHALLLAPDNFTPPARTPWGGTAIVSRYKNDLGLDPRAVVGESWEVSAGEEFPSRVLGTGEALRAVLARDVDRWLGEEAAAGGTALLVKLLDAADHLSVQIHPDDAYAGLAPGECGKPESWYVLDAAPGAGLYLGLAEGATPDLMRDALAREGDVASLLAFVPVAPGDFFVVEAGTAHAIGRGVTLVEPQVVRPGRRGVTYRYWDWNRRYDAQGNASPGGQPRALHVDHALAVTAWGAPRGDGFLRAARARAGAADVGAPLALTALCGRAGAALGSAFLEVARVAGTGSLALPASGRLRAVTVAEGALHVDGDGATVTVTRGRSAVIAARADVVLRGEGAHAVVASAL
ncbi:MAG: type I phosphomannose isomerase catalytic subunit [Polyangiales bacterium]